jgi:hypothetical protein
MWNYIDGLALPDAGRWKVTKTCPEFISGYEYNSQNQITILEYQNGGDSDYKRFVYFYDNAGRMQAVSTEESGPPPDYNYPFAVYKYNENSQIDSLLLNNLAVVMAYTFNSRNWITECDNSNQIFGYTLDYLKNGNIRSVNIIAVFPKTSCYKPYLSIRYISPARAALPSCNSLRLIVSKTSAGEW